LQEICAAVADAKARLQEPEASSTDTSPEASIAVTSPEASSTVSSPEASSTVTLPEARSAVTSPEASSTVTSLDALFAAALTPSATSKVQNLHPGVKGSTSVTVDRFEDQHAAVVTVRAAVHLKPCDGAAEACVPMSDNIPTVDVAVAFASSLAAQAAVTGSQYASSVHTMYVAVIAFAIIHEYDVYACLQCVRYAFMQEDA
jgi:hypothetical protein